MCGIVGLAGTIGFKEEKVLKDLLLLDVIRGKHSTGIASMYMDAGKAAFGIAKDKLNAVDFMDGQEFIKLMAKKHYAIIGHNRWATKGVIIKENAHPFEFDNIIGVHNGSLSSHYDFHEGSKFTVDSQALYSELNHSDVATMWGKTNGAAALVWLDKRDNTVNFLRNKERPLWFTTLNKGATLIWASEPWMLHVACGRQDVDLDSNPREVAINEHYQFQIELKEKQKIPMKRTKVEPYVAPEWESSRYSYGYSNSGYRSSGNDYYSQEEQAWLDKEGIKAGDILEFIVTKIEDYKDTYGKNMCRVIGKTLLDSPVRLWSVDADIWDEMLLKMWDIDGLVFTGKFGYVMSTGLVVNISSVQPTGYTLRDIEEAQQKFEEEKKLISSPKLIHSKWKVGCSVCRTLVKDYFITKESKILCEACNNL